MRRNLGIIFALLMIFSSIGAFAQKGLIDIKKLQDREYYPTGIYNLQFVGEKGNYAYTKTGQELIIGDKKAEKTVLTSEDLNKDLKHFASVEFISETEFAFLSADNKTIYLYNIETKQMTPICNIKEGAENLELDLKNGSAAYTIEGNVWFSTKGKEPKQLTTDGGNGITYGVAVHRNEFGIEKGFFLSNDASKLAFYRMDESMVKEYPLVNTALRQAEETPIRYPMAGMKSHEVTVLVYDSKTDKTIELNTRKDNSLEEREAYLTNLTWNPEGTMLYIQKLNRKQNHVELIAYDVVNGNPTKTLFSQSNEKYVEPESPIFFLPNNSQQFIYLSEADGFNHAYLYNIDGTLISQLTSGDWMINSIEGFNKKATEFYFYATKDSPLEQNLYAYNFKTKKIRRCTPEKGTHHVVFNTDGTLFLDTYTSSVEPRRVALYDNKAKQVKEIFKSENPWANLDKPEIDVFTIKAKDGTDLYARMIKPLNFDVNKKYPVIVYVYGGPHAQLITESWLSGANNFFLFLAQQGYIVWTVDSRGSANRGFEFESAIWRNCGSIEVSDQMDGVNYLKSLPYVDSERIGVDGWSYGGFMTISLKLKNPGVFKTATAGGPVIDWKWYEVMYGERYMSSPEDNKEGYEKSSLLNYADQLEGKLLVIHGAQDPTVVMQHSLEFINKCIKAGKQVDYFIYPDHEHNVRGKDRIHLYEKIYQYHKENL
ncbi:MAG: DPP IV N-terminal domain-containing protein [Bacteroidales bacterium]|nr:DPP IV N-terminal domain-containing protein [Bacteroidales bacterium]